MAVFFAKSVSVKLVCGDKVPPCGCPWKFMV